MNRIQSQKATLFCVSLVTHVYNTSIQVPPVFISHFISLKVLTNIITFRNHLTHYMYKCYKNLEKKKRGGGRVDLTFKVSVKI